MSDLRDALLARADDRLVLGHRLSEWCGHAPVLEEDLALANIALDLLEQAQQLYEWVGARSDPAREADSLAFFRGATEYQNLLLVEQPNGDFAHTVVRQLLFDSVDLMWLSSFSQHPECTEDLAEWVTKAQREGRYHLRHSEAWVRRLGDGTYRVSIEGHRFEVVVARGMDTDWGCVDGRTHRWPRGPRDGDAPPDTDDAPIAATMPATVTAVKVAAGQTVARGDTLVVLEAMKMEIPLRAPRDGRVTAVRCTQGDQVDPGVPLIDLG